MKIKIVKFKNVKSTNDTAIRLFKNKSHDPLLVLSSLQSKGKGTMGKSWVSKKGNLFISILFTFNQKKIRFQQFAIVNAFLIKKVIERFIKKKINVKWPNDLLYKKKKFCGILQETFSHQEKDYLVIGIGINTNILPKNKSFSSTSLKNIIRKNINNHSLLISIKKEYEKLISRIKKNTYFELIKNYK